MDSSFHSTTKKTIRIHFSLNVNRVSIKYEGNVVKHQKKKEKQNNNQLNRRKKKGLKISAQA